MTATARTGIVVTDTDGVITSRSTGAEHLLGHRAADAVGQRVAPGRFVFLGDPREVVVGAMAIFAEPAGAEEAWGAVLPLGAG